MLRRVGILIGAFVGYWVIGLEVHLQAQDSVQSSHDGSPQFVQTAFRFRADSGSLNQDAGWLGALNESVAIPVDQPFRVRFEMEGRAATRGMKFGLQYRINEGEWIDMVAEDFPKPEASSPPLSVVSTTAYDNGADTLDLLPVSSIDFGGGAGLSLVAETPEIPIRFSQTEWEWALVVRRFADKAIMTKAGDRVALRMVTSEGLLCSSRTNAEFTVEIPSRHVGGTFVETPGRIGPWQSSNGDLYFIMEPTETDNLLLMVKSSDGGASWREVDPANRPTANDLEGVASVLEGGTIHLLHQTSDEVWYHTFHTSDHAERPDSWGVRDELVATPEEPPTQVASISVRNDGSVVGVYGGPAKVHLRIRDARGNWADEMVLDAQSSPNLSGPHAALGKKQVVHLAYTGDDGTAWYRRLMPSGAVTDRICLATDLGTTEYDVGAILPLAYVAENDATLVVYRVASGRLWGRLIHQDGSPSEAFQVSDRDVIQNPVDSDQPAADTIVVRDEVHVLFVAEADGQLYHTFSSNGIDWRPSKRIVGGIRGQWVRGNLLRVSDGSTVIGYIYDAGSNGGAGMNRFGEIEVDR